MGLAAMARNTSEEFVQDAVMIFLLNLQDSLNVSNAMSDIQIQEAARLIRANYYFLTPFDFKLASDGIKMGKYGQSFNRLDVQVIGTWLDAYCQERSEQAASVSRQKSEDGKKPLTKEELAFIRQMVYSDTKKLDEKRKLEAEEEKKIQEEADRKHREYLLAKMNYQPPQEDGNERFKRIMEEKADRGA